MNFSELYMVLSKSASNLVKALHENEKTNLKRLTPYAFSRAVGSDKLVKTQMVINELIKNKIINEHLELTSRGEKLSRSLN